MTESRGWFVPHIPAPEPVEGDEFNETLRVEHKGAAVTTPTGHPDQELADEQAAGLRALADMIQANPELASLAGYLKSTNVFYGWSKDDLALIARTAKASGFKVDKDAFSDVYKLELRYGAVGFSVLSNRDQVCERVVTGTKIVTKTVKDPEVLATVPEVEVTEEVEIVEWKCRPLLATGTDAA